jgi:hypothetical protein
MQRLLVISIALAIGCRDVGMEQLRDIKVAVCACKTTRCAEASMGVISLTKVTSNPRSQRIARDMLDCFAKLTAKERPVTGPDDPEPAGSATAPATP